jgi:hypothetical protein
MKRVYFAAIAFSLLLLAGAAFADEVKLRPGTADPSAVGVVDYHHDRNGNTSFELKVDHLAPPVNLQPPKQIYVVWVQAPGQPPENKGVLKVNHDQKGDIKMVSPHQAFDVFVTAEDTPSVSAPSGPEVLRGSVTNQ